MSRRGLLWVLLAASASFVAEAKPIVIAHRGASAYLPEHTLAAKALAYGLGADYIEQDVVLTKDDVPVVLHDIYIDTVTDVANAFPRRKRKDGRYYAIDFTLAELRHLRVTERFHPKTRKSVYPQRFPTWQSRFQIATLAEEIEMIQGLNHTMGRDVGLYVEFKNPGWHQTEGKDITKIVHDTLTTYGYPNLHRKIFIQCFDADALKRLKTEFKSEIPRIQLLGESTWRYAPTDFDKLKTEAGMKEVAQYAQGIGPWTSQIFLGLDAKGKPQLSNLVTWAHKHKLLVHPYTLRAEDLPDEMTMDQAMEVLFKAAKVDGVFTDHPDRVVSYLGSLP